ncbi:transposase [Stutzerimonas stutzeri]|uniref:transposase n=2 Tax=Stutzerimonas stutzeri TaxID=316 RepID=UPI0026C07707
MKRIAVDLAKSIFQVAERLLVGQVGRCEVAQFWGRMRDQADRFASGRHLSAWLGMTPSEYSSGERRRLGRISCKGNVYVRTLLIHGARAALLAAKRCKARTPERLTQLQSWALQTAERIGHNKAAVALANKLVRIC